MLHLPTPIHSCSGTSIHTDYVLENLFFNRLLSVCLLRKSVTFEAKLIYR